MERRHEAGGGHRARHADLSLTAHLGARDRGVALVEHADCRGGEQKADHALVVRARLEASVEMQHRRHDPGGAVGRRGDDAAAGRVLLVHRECISIDPVHDVERLLIRPLRQDTVELRRAPAHFQHSRQQAALTEAALDATLHHLPDMHELRANALVRVPGTLVGEDELEQLEPVLATQREQLGGGSEWKWRRGVSARLPRLGLVAPHDEPAADRVVVLLAQLAALRRERREAHAV